MTKYKNLFGKLWSKLEDKNYSTWDSFKFLEERFIKLPPLIIYNPNCPNYEREVYESVYRELLQEALIEIDYLKHK